MTRAGFLLVAAFCASAAPAAGQEEGCVFLDPTANIERRQEFGTLVTTTISPNIACADGRRIRADEMTTYEASGLTVFTGNVFFQDEQQTLRAFSANYYEREGRLEASGNVELIDLETGTEITGLGLVYRRAGFGADVERIRVFGGRPRALLFPSATPPDSVELPPEMVGDSAAVEAALDSAAAVDTTGAVPGADADRAMAGDSLSADPVADSTAAPSDSITARPDSTGAAAGDTIAAPGDSIATPDAVPDTIPELPADTLPPEPYEVFGDEIEIVGNDYFKARGEVQILRDSMDARADSLEYIQTQGRLYLDGNAFVDQPGVDLSAREIMILLPGDVIRDLVARGDGRLLADRLDLASPYIRVELDQGELQGLWAAPLYREGQESLEPPLRTAAAGMEPDSADFGRPLAISEDVSMTGDSLDVRAPGQVLERVIAIGRARAVSSARDSLNTEDTPEIIRSDWIEGDTVVAVFVENPNAPAPDEVAGK